MAGLSGRNVSHKRPVKVLAASQFHSSTTLKRQKAVQAAEADCQLGSNQTKQHTVQSFNPLNAPYKAFKTQKEACDFLDKQPCSAILRTFAEEVSATGKRVFIVTSAELFWQRYKELPANGRHHYEIIRESTPCNLYFDLEFCPQTNPGVDGPRLVRLLITGIAQQLQELYDIPFHPSFVLELDSSTPTKFSRHLVVRLPRLAFADCCHAGRFARLVLLRLLQRGQSSSRYGQLLVWDKEGTGVTSFVDMGVYTRNRAFRLYLSSKFGKDRILRLTPRFGGANRDPHAVFHDLLVSVLHTSSSKAAVTLADSSTPGHSGVSCARDQANTPGDGQHQRQYSPVCFRPPRQQAAGKFGRQQRISLLYCDYNDWQQELQQLPAAWQQVHMLQLNPLPHQQAVGSSPQHSQQYYASNSSCRTIWQHQQGPGAYGADDSRTAGPVVVHRGASPYLLLEQFILSICTQGGVQGEIRSWVSMPASTSVAFNMRNNRWCGNVERQHKSNGIYYVVDLAGGVYYQKCYDPECRNYRSNCMPLPTTVWQKYRQKQPQQLQHQLPGASHGLSLEHHRRQQVGTVAEELKVDEDQECLQLLQQYEGVHHHHHQQQQQQQHPGLAADADALLDEDDLYLQLLEQVEQQAGLGT